MKSFIVSTLYSKSVKVPEYNMQLSSDGAGGSCGQSVPLLTRGHQVTVLQRVSSAQEVLRYRVSDTTRGSPRHDLNIRIPAEKYYYRPLTSILWRPGVDGM